MSISASTLSPDRRRFEGERYPEKDEWVECDPVDPTENR